MAMPEDLEAQIKHVGITSPLREVLESFAREITTLKAKVFCGPSQKLPPQELASLASSTREVPKKTEKSTGG